MMGKIKLNLESGVVVEKPLINAFRANNFEYVILDNEMNGSMGLPIILVCKLENGKLIKIEDQNEWQIVKEYLKNIIAGSQVELVKIPNVLPANDIYYTQLTLPVPSFDALKKAYTMAGTESSEGANANATPVSAGSVAPTPVVNEAPSVPTPMPTTEAVPNVTPSVAPENVTPVEAPTPQVEVAPTPTTSEPTPVDNVVNTVNPTPVVDLGIPNAPVMDNPAPINPAPTPTIDLNAPIPVFGNTNEGTNNVEETPVASALEIPGIENATPVPPTVEPTPVSENEPVVSIAPSSETESPFKEQKEAFMQACENMFDALVQKFEKELENNKQN